MLVSIVRDGRSGRTRVMEKERWDRSMEGRKMVDQHKEGMESGTKRVQVDDVKVHAGKLGDTSGV